MPMLQRLRESLALILIAVLPLHAMLVTVATHVLEGQNHAPLVVIALWKEVLLAVIVLLALIEIARIKKATQQRSVWSWDQLDWCIVFGIGIGVVVSFSGGAGSFSGIDLSAASKRFLLGFKYDFLPLVAFFFLRRALWSSIFFVAAARIIVMVGAVAAVFGIVTLFLPLSFFTAIGYSDLHSLYLPNSSIASFQFLEGTEIRRIQSFMSGPNQFGLWLLLPFAASLQLCIKSLREQRRIDAVFYAAGEALIIVALFYTYSRSAWIGAAAILLTVSVLLLRRVIRTWFYRSLAIIIFAVLVGFIVMVGVRVSPQILVRTQSLKGHFEKPLAAIQTMRAHPFGLGLGTAGPASNRLSDTCIFLDSGADITWAQGRPDLCVFIDNVQKLPAGKVCDCPVLTENWYLQWGVEMGVAGLLLSLAIIFLVFIHGLKFPVSDVRIFPVLAFLGVAVGGIFLHSFEDSAVAYSLWLLLSAGESRS